MRIRNKKCVEDWVWGDYSIDGKHPIFNPSAVGGYRCKICFQNLEKRVEILKKHLIRSHGRHDFHSFAVPKIKEKCKFCMKALEPHPGKMQRHRRQSCKITGQIEEKDGAVEDESDDDEVDKVEIEEERDFEVRNMEDRNPEENHHEETEPKENVDDRTEDILKDLQRKIKESAENMEILKEERTTEQNESKRQILEMKKKLENLEENLEENMKKMSEMEGDLDNVEGDIGLKEEMERKLIISETERVKENKENEKRIKELEEEVNILKCDREKELVQNEKEITRMKEKIEKYKESDRKLKEMKIKFKTVDKERDKIITEKNKLEKVNETYHKEMKKVKEKETEYAERINEKRKVIKDMMKTEELVFKEVKVGDKIGSGSFGDIYSAKYRGKKVAIKETKYHSTSITELMIMSKVDLPNIVKADAILISDDRIHISMELFDCDLHTFIVTKNMEGDIDKKWRIEAMLDTQMQSNNYTAITQH